MQLFAVFAAATTLIAGSNALFIPRNIHVADFRLYSAEGCHDGNLGVWTVIDDDFKNGECKGLNDSEPKSLSLTDINKGCTCKETPRGAGMPNLRHCFILTRILAVTAYTDDKCTEGKKDFTKGHCFDNKVAWKAWSMKCDYKD
ncbi:hypothetical protein THARTR1_05271 [Trichoderma harzianum]|uniref:Secreted protein n=1 Tax=Trichoderma harzianum TaxID=5544 RepID=A0A2K0U8G3_TRIHA|nr:hypothetical protein THARTR1_05271 [Trichoderma harzianum]